MKFNNRFKFLDSLLKIINAVNIDKSACVHGKFIFNYLSSTNFSNDDIIDVYFTTNKLGEFDINLLELQFLNLFIALQNKHKFIEKYKLINSFNFKNMYKVPSIILKYEFETDKFYVNITAFQPKCIGNLSHNLIRYSNKKFDTLCSLSIKEILDLNNDCKSIFNLDLKKIQDKAFPNVSVPRFLKQKYLSILIYNFEIINKFMLDNDSINIINIPYVSVEDKEDCIITSDEKPYLKLQLECDHFVSLQAYRGIVFNKLSYSEHIRCPFCRNDLKVKF